MTVGAQATQSSGETSAPLRELLAFAKHPFLALRPRATPTRYSFIERGWQHALTVRPARSGGQIAAQADGDILAFFGGVLAARMNRGEIIGTEVQATPGAILQAIGRPTDGAQHKRLREALDRLSGTEVELTPVRRVERSEHPPLRADLRLFCLIEGFETSPPGRRAPWLFRLPDWFSHEIAERRMRKIEAQDLRARGLERRVAGWARGYAGGRYHTTHVISMEAAHRGAGGTTAPRPFRHELRRLVVANPLPDHDLVLDADGERLRIVRRQGASVQLAPIAGPGDDQMGWDGPGEVTVVYL